MMSASNNAVKISVVIITLNEEKNIGRCLDSVQGIADEVVVVDSYSTDKTEEICLSYGTRFIKNTFLGYVEQVNFALAQATYDHVLCLDADEALSEKLQVLVSKVKADWTHSGYQMNRLTNYCGQWIKHCGWYPDKKIRLFNRKEAKWTGENPHYRVELPATSVLYLPADILHYSFPSISSHAATANNFSSVATREALKKNKRIYFVIHILLNPLFTFIKKYFFQLGFLDGYYGFVICILSAHSNFLKYAKIWSLKKERREGNHQ